MTASVGKYEYETITEVQKELHNTKSEDEEITSNFFREFRKTTWWTQITSKLHQRTATENQVVWSVNSTFHWLLSVYKCQTFPTLRVKPEYDGKVEICWPHNLASATTVKGSVIIDEALTLQTIDHHWLNIYPQFYMKEGAGFEKLHDKNVGNVPYLEQWSNFLPAYITTEDQPFYFKNDLSLAIPILLCSLSRVEFHYIIRNKIQELLRMRLIIKKEIKVPIPNKAGNIVDLLAEQDSSKNKNLIDELSAPSAEKFQVKEIVEYREIPFNPKYIQGSNTPHILPFPEMWGRYAYITDDECKWWKDTDEECHKSPYEVYTEDIIACDTTSEKTYGETVDIELRGEYPAKAMFWVAEHNEALKNRNFANYTTNISNVHEGWNPIDKVSLHYSSHPRFVDMDSYHFNRMEPWYRFPSAPRDEGYCAYSFAGDSTSLDADIAIVPSAQKAILGIKLGDTNPFIKPINDIDDKKHEIDELVEELNFTKPKISKDHFLVRVRLLVTRKLTITSEDKKFKFTIV